MDSPICDIGYSEEILSGEIDELTIYHRVYTVKGSYPVVLPEDSAVFLIVLKGRGWVISDSGQQSLEQDSLVVIPKGTRKISIELVDSQPLHFLEFTKPYSEDDKVELISSEVLSGEFYTVRFQDCKPYTEKIKSPNTISRTVLPSNIIPRVALGTVESIGPDKVGEHSHPMLEQLFLGLGDNAITVHTDEASCEMGEYSLLHIPLGSNHWVEVAEGRRMNYMWMDFFLTKAGEVWLDTHKLIDESAVDGTAP